MRNGAHYIGVGIFLVLTTLSCHRAERPRQIELYFPTLLVGDHELWNRFKDRVTELEITAKDQGKTLWVHHYAGLESERLEVPASELEGESTTLQVKVWDRIQEGGVRPYPCLEGAGKWLGQTARVYLSLRVPLEEYRGD